MQIVAPTTKETNFAFFAYDIAQTTHNSGVGVGEGGGVELITFVKSDKMINTLSFTCYHKGLVVVEIWSFSRIM